jgi:succinate dehydrogenase hydrophobic anchor subunit
MPERRMPKGPGGARPVFVDPLSGSHRRSCGGCSLGVRSARMKANLGGVRPCVLQRATALLALAFLLYFLLHRAIAPPDSRAECRAWILSPFMRLALVLFVGLDYIKPLGLRLAALCLPALWLGTAVAGAISALNTSS